MHTVSALIPHYGDPAPTLELIAQLRNQTGVESLQIVVSDDCSPEPFPEGEDYELIRREKNGGFGSSVNSAASLATGDLLLILNSDLTLTSDFVEALVREAEEVQPAVVGPTVIENGTPIYSARRWPTALQQAWEWLTPLARFKDTLWWHRVVGHDVEAYRATRTKQVDWLMGACLMIPREAFEQAGGFDERFHMNSEEIDLQRRLTATGVPSVLLPQVRVDHEGGGSSHPNRRRRWLVDSRFVYAHKWGGIRRLALLLSLASAVNLAWNGLRRLRRVEGATPVSNSRFEFSLIKHGWEHKRGKPSSSTPEQ